MKINVIDLFAGCGGLTDGFLQTQKFNTLAAVDWEFSTVRTLKNRLESKWNYALSESQVIHFDIQRTQELIDGFDDSLYGKSVGLAAVVGQSKVNCIVGGPPCQAYSIAGRVRDTNGMKDDYRNFLFESYVKMVSHFKPAMFVFENVEGILSAEPGGISITKRIREAFSEIGYEITDDLRENALFDTSYYRVPQRRKRVIIYGVKKGETSTVEISKFYSKMKSRKTDSPENSEVAFAELPGLYPIRNNTGITKKSHEPKGTEILPFNHEPRFHSERDIQIFRTLASDIQSGTFKYNSSASLINLYQEVTGKTSQFHKYHVIRLDKPSNTIPAHLYKDGLRHIHPDPLQARSITVREAARIQSFDDDFEFKGSRGDQYKMIGNAVPPRFARIIAEVVYELFEEYELKTEPVFAAI